MFFYSSPGGYGAADRESVYQVDRTARQARNRTDELQNEVNRLTLISEALWQLLRRRLDLTDDELMAEITRLDLSDGKADGKITKEPLTCDACQRKNGRRHVNCIYCGAPLKSVPFG